MKILILGHKGMLGNAATQYFKYCGYNIYTTDLRWDTQEFKDFVMETDAYYIINCIGAIPQKNSSSKDYASLNIDLPIFLESVGVRVIHPSTDCEFSGKLEYPQKYNKTDFRDAYDDYGVSKAYISEIIENNFVNTKVIRTSIIGHEIFHKKSLLEWFLNVNESKDINGFINYYWNGVTTLCWCEIAEQMMLSWHFYPSLTQVGTEGVSKYDLLTIMKKVYNKNVKINKFPTSPLNKMLKSDILVSSIEDQLKDLKNFFEK